MPTKQQLENLVEQLNKHIDKLEKKHARSKKYYEKLVQIKSNSGQHQWERAVELAEIVAGKDKEIENYKQQAQREFDQIKGLKARVAELKGLKNEACNNCERTERELAELTKQRDANTRQNTALINDANTENKKRHIAETKCTYMNRNIQSLDRAIGVMHLLAEHRREEDCD